jgi:uncharacterized protein (TIGR00730 family)
MNNLTPATTTPADTATVREEIQFLDGPQSRWKEFTFSIRTFVEMIRGFRALHFAGPCITFFGSARFEEGHRYYECTRELAGKVARLGFTVMTGGGPGLMEAANRGAREAGGRSVGCNIKLPMEQKPNPFLDKWVDIQLFFVRKIMLVKYSYAFIVMPGGYGTMDEYFEALTLIQTRKINDFPVIIFSAEYHRELSEHIRLMGELGAISAADSKLYFVTDSIDEVIDILKTNCIERFGLGPKKKLTPLRWLLERGWSA